MKCSACQHLHLWWCLFFCLLPAVKSLNSLNDQIASFMVTGPKPVEQEEPVFCPPEKETLQKSMTLMRHLLVDAQVQETVHFSSDEFRFGHWALQVWLKPWIRMIIFIIKNITVFFTTCFFQYVQYFNPHPQLVSLLYQHTRVSHFTCRIPGVKCKPLFF